MERAVAHILVQPPVLDRHRRLERQRAQERDPALVDQVTFGCRQLGDTHGAGRRDERQLEHDLATEAPQACLLIWITRHVRDVDQNVGPIPRTTRASTGRSADGLGSGLERPLDRVRPERDQPTGLRPKRVEDALVEFDRRRQVPRDERAEDRRIARLGKVG